MDHIPFLQVTHRSPMYILLGFVSVCQCLSVFVRVCQGYIAFLQALHHQWSTVVRPACQQSTASEVFSCSIKERHRRAHAQSHPPHVASKRHAPPLPPPFCCLQALLEAWHAELARKPLSMSEADACGVLGLSPGEGGQVAEEDLKASYRRWVGCWQAGGRLRLQEAGGERGGGGGGGARV